LDKQQTFRILRFLPGIYPKILKIENYGGHEMVKDPCLFCCRGCLQMLIETVILIAAFFAVVLATVYPLLGM